MSALSDAFPQGVAFLFIEVFDDPVDFLLMFRDDVPDFFGIGLEDLFGAFLLFGREGHMFPIG